ncbi:ankyrin repeat domain-containing protein [Burkholderia sp. JP2-270]|uniref:ankyrin repeat domain-containing protein n=1 Tax=Burkholderia sp. JP2-270 TaxID=2217913 RepID=UPI001EF7A8FF|nr:ankyrin repeat domain-containing protein [Burkholderia sp. JP2-270]
MTTLTSAVAAADGGALEGRLRSAADRGDAGDVRALLERGAQVDARDGQGRTALLIVTHGNHDGAARVLIDAGADVNSGVV